jgi:hypothetical protein
MWLLCPSKSACESLKPRGSDSTSSSAVKFLTITGGRSHRRGGLAGGGIVDRGALVMSAGIARGQCTPGPRLPSLRDNQLDVLRAPRMAMPAPPSDPTCRTLVQLRSDCLWLQTPDTTGPCTVCMFSSPCGASQCDNAGQSGLNPSRSTVAPQSTYYSHVNFDVTQNTECTRISQLTQSKQCATSPLSSYFIIRRFINLKGSDFSIATFMHGEHQCYQIYPFSNPVDIILSNPQHDCGSVTAAEIIL